MSDIEKAIFKVKLELEIITPEEIQRWAIETLEKNSSNDLALDICFLSTSDHLQPILINYPEVYLIQI